MYAPKFQSHRDEFERARDIVAYRVDTLADEAKAELKEMVRRVEGEVLPPETPKADPYAAPSQEQIRQLLGYLQFQPYNPPWAQRAPYQPGLHDPYAPLRIAGISALFGRY